MAVTYAVVAHRAPEIVGELVRAVAPHRVLVHLDAKVEIEPFEAAVRDSPTVSFLTDRVAVTWAGWSQVEAALRLMRAAATTMAPDDRLVMLSGDSHPLQPPAAIDRFFRDHRTEEFISCIAWPVEGAEDLKVRAQGSLTRLSRLRLEGDPRGRMPFWRWLVNRLEIRRPWRRALGGRRPYGGGQWWALSGAAVSWLLEEAHRDRRFRRLCRTMAVPDEFFLHTLLMNSPFGAAVRPGLMFTDWSRSADWSPSEILPVHVDEIRSAFLGRLSDADGPTDAPAVHEPPLLYARKITSLEIPHRIHDQVWSVPLR